MANRRGVYRLPKIRGKKRAKLATYAKVLRDGIEECGIRPGQVPYFNKVISTRFGNLALEGPFGRIKITCSPHVPEGTAYGLSGWLPDANGQFFGIDRGADTIKLATLPASELVVSPLTMNNLLKSLYSTQRIDHLLYDWPKP